MRCLGPFENRGLPHALMKQVSCASQVINLVPWLRSQSVVKVQKDKDREAREGNSPHRVAKERDEFTGRLRAN